MRQKRGRRRSAAGDQSRAGREGAGPPLYGLDRWADQATALDLWSGARGYLLWIALPLKLVVLAWWEVRRRRR
jgi:hypothetical protein